MDDRFVSLLAGQIRDRKLNANTIGIKALPDTDGPELRTLFVRHYAEFRQYIVGCDKPGVAVVAIELANDRVAGVACVDQLADEPNVLHAGRHSQADLLLDNNGGVSLRHFSVLVEPADYDGSVRYRVVDLRSLQGFRDEDGRSLAGVRSDGPVLLSTVGYALFVLVTGKEEWPEEPGAAWAQLPERVYLEQSLRADPRMSPKRRHHVRLGMVPLHKRMTLVERVSAPSRVANVSPAVDDETRVGELAIVGAAGMRRVPVTARALRDGIVLGREERCESALAFLYQGLSRVHMLLIEVAGQAYAVDTASTNGCFATTSPDAPFRIRALRTGDTIRLGRHVQVTWTAA